jgi:hypothetical protein
VAVPVYVPDLAEPEVEVVVVEPPVAAVEPVVVFGDEVDPVETMVEVLPAAPATALADPPIGALVADGVLKLSNRASAAPVMMSAKLARLGIWILLDQYAKLSR